MNNEPPAINRISRIDESLSIELTTRCNSPCSHCFARAGQAEDTNLSSSLVNSILDEGFANGYRHLHLTGGEPFLWPGIFELLDNALLKGYQSIFINTNGLLMTEEIARRLALYKKLAISISMQGPEKLHDQVRGQGTYLRAAKGIQTALNAGLKVTIFTTIGHTLMKHLPHFVARLHDSFQGIDRLTLIQLIRVGGKFAKLSDDMMTPDGFLGFVRMVSAMNLYGLKTDVLYNPLINVVAAKLKLPRVPKSFSLYRPHKLFFRANRTITHAHSTKENYGWYRPGVIGKILASDLYAAAVNPDEATCPECRFVEDCRANGLLHPPEELANRVSDRFYCQSVLTLADPLGKRLKTAGLDKVDPTQVKHILG